MLYRYVGARGIAERAGLIVRGVLIASPEDVVRWITSTADGFRTSSEVTVTFVVNEEGKLLIADRHSERRVRRRSAGTRRGRTVFRA